MNRFHVPNFRNPATMTLRAVQLLSLLTITVLMALAGQTSIAGIYEWTDKDGQRVYSDRPPVDADSRRIDPTPGVDTDAALEAQADVRQRLEELDKERAEHAEAEQQKQRELEIARHNCERARQKLARLEMLPRIVAMEGDGSTQRLDESERQAKIEEARKEIEEYCH